MLLVLNLLSTAGCAGQAASPIWAVGAAAAAESSRKLEVVEWWATEEKGREGQ